MANLNHLSMTTALLCDDLNFKRGDKFRVRYGADAVKRAFQIFPNLQELSYVACEMGTTYHTFHFIGQKAVFLQGRCMYTPLTEDSISEIDRWF